MNNPPCRDRGFTLIELLITLSIAAILLGFVAPSFTKIIEKNQIDTQMIELRKIITFARNYALTNNTAVSFCGVDTEECILQWRKKFVVFLDENDNKTAEDDEILKTLELGLDNAYVVNRFGAIEYNRFLPQGTMSRAASIIYCSEAEKPENFRRITWNRMGRSYLAKDTNNDGIVEDTDGSNIECDS